MSKSSEILLKAQSRAQEGSLPYAGALLPQEAYELLKQIPGARLVDVRTHAEIDWVGYIPDSLHIEWNVYPSGDHNSDFLKQLQSEVSKDSPVFFICRSGGRSHSAAKLATEAGYVNCYNVLQGFEGDKDHHSHRGVMNGWRHAGLPWKQT